MRQAFEGTSFANAGIPVTVYEKDKAALDAPDNISFKTLSYNNAKTVKGLKKGVITGIKIQSFVSTALTGGGYNATNWTEWETDAGVILGYDETGIIHGGAHATLRGPACRSGRFDAEGAREAESHPR